MTQLPRGWATCTLEDIADVSMGQSPPGSSYTNSDNGVLFLQGSAEFGEVVPTPVKRTTDPKTLADDRAVLLSVRAPVGDTNLSPGEIAIGRGLAAVTPRAGINPRFCLWLLRAKRAALEQNSTGTTFAGVTARTVRTLPLWLPPRPEQDRIMATVSAQMTDLDAASQALDRCESSLIRYRGAVLAAAVTGQLTVAEGEVESARDLLEEVLNSRQERWETDHCKSPYRRPAEPTPPVEIELPEGWTWATIDQLAILVEYGSSSKTTQEASGVPVLRMGNLVDGRLRLDNLKFLPNDHREFPSLFLEDGDVLFNRTNSAELVGKAAVYRGELEPCSFASYLIRVRVTSRYRPELLVYFLSSSLGRAWVRSVVSQQVGQANVNGTKLKQLTVPVPPPEEQEEICTVVEQQLRLVSDVQQIISAARVKSEQFRNVLLQKAFSGQLTWQDPADEPAIVLLEKARAQRNDRRTRSQKLAA